MKIKNYFLTGVYPSSETGESGYQRWAESVRAKSPEEAERKMLKEYPGLVIAGVVENPDNKVKCVDTKAFSPAP